MTRRCPLLTAIWTTVIFGRGLDAIHIGGGLDPMLSIDDETEAPYYKFHKGKHCGGKSIKTWASGESSNYGEGSDLSVCKATCSAHEDCAGFALGSTTGKCSFWKSGHLSLHHTDTKSSTSCYEKKQGKGED